MCRPLGKRHDLIDRRVLRRRERCDDRRQIDARNDPYFRVVEKVMSNIGRRGADEIREDQDAVVAPKTVDQLGGMRDARIDIEIGGHVKTGNAVAARIFRRTVDMLTAAFKRGRERCMGDDAYPDHEDLLQQLNAGSLALRL